MMICLRRQRPVQDGVSRGAAIARIRRSLAKSGQKLSRGRVAEWGEVRYDVIDVGTKRTVEAAWELEELGRRLGVLNTIAS